MPGLADSLSPSVPEHLRKHDIDGMAEQAGFMLDQGCEPASAFKQAASDFCIQYGTQDMHDFVTWCYAAFCGEGKQ